MANINLLACQLFDECTLSSSSYTHDRDIDVFKATSIHASAMIQCNRWQGKVQTLHHHSSFRKRALDKIGAGRWDSSLRSLCCHVDFAA